MDDLPADLQNLGLTQLMEESFNTQDRLTVHSNTPVLDNFVYQYQHQTSNIGESSSQQQYVPPYNQIYSDLYNRLSADVNKLFRTMYDEMYIRLQGVIQTEISLRCDTGTDQQDTASRKRKRSSMTDEQYDILQSFFDDIPSPSLNQMKKLSEDSGMD